MVISLSGAFSLWQQVGQPCSLQSPEVGAMQSETMRRKQSRCSQLTSAKTVSSDGKRLTIPLGLQAPQPGSTVDAAAHAEPGVDGSHDRTHCGSGYIPGAPLAGATDGAVDHSCGTVRLSGSASQ